MTTLTILMPAYNEEATIIQILERIAECPVDGVSYEVIVVDDGSKDRTVELLESRPELYTRLVKQPQNGGKGAAVKAGLAAATGDYVLFQDADLEYDPADYAKMLLPVSRFKADVVMGSRVVAPEFTRVYYFWHKVGNRFITLMFNIFFNMTFTDIYSCYLMFRRDLVDPKALVSEGWDQHAEILARSVRRATQVYEVPISYHGRSYAEGKKIKAYHVISVILMIIRMRFAA
ncbi:MAG: glycosyltransferase family 2 protein [Rhodobacterales bacterium]|nr:glycosyltransferase family 2 protein [Rhodobacterales bacterium]